ncbi:MAG: aminodeoxychorismate synthase component I [Lachnospiraceae bacterium]|nr:aminodeoxychorismate synthase component I [Lachnospiraceae bacterium]
MKCIKTWREYPSSDLIFYRLKEKEEAVFLDSSTRGELGQYSVIACRPYRKLLSYGDYFTVDGQRREGDFSEYVKHYLNNHREENTTGLPIISGAVGYFSYDFGRVKEGVESCHSKTLDIPDAVLYFYDVFVVEDHVQHQLHLIANGHTQGPELCAEEIAALIFDNSQSSCVAADLNGENIGIAVKRGVFPAGPEPDPTKYNSRIVANFTPEQYMDAVDHMIRYIVEGDIYVVNMTQQLQIHSDCPPYEMFTRLRRNNPSPFGAYLDYGEFQIVCASPERFMRMKNGKIKTRPIKGTRKRGATPEEDAMLKQELADSEKDQSELLMIVDLERNDLNRVCTPGSVQVTELFKVETYATVFHLVANVEGQILPGCNAMDLIQAAFPGGSITGAPKLRAMELIDQEEHLCRNLYTGSIGYISLNGDCDLNIVIRTAVCKDGVYHLGVGGGITCESELEFEYDETWQKAKALLNALDLESTDGEHYQFTLG